MALGGFFVVLCDLRVSNLGAEADAPSNRGALSSIKNQRHPIDSLRQPDSFGLLRKLNFLRQVPAVDPNDALLIEL